MNRSLRLTKFKNKYSFLIAALFLTIAGLSIIIIGDYFTASNILPIILHALGGAIISLGMVEVIHEMAVAKRVRNDFLILADFIDKGIERLCTQEEMPDISLEALRSTKSFKIIGIGISWIWKDPYYSILLEKLERRNSVVILIPDPLSPEIMERYNVDEPPTYELGLEGLARRIINWHNLSKEYNNLELRAFHRYPVVNVSVYDKHVFASPVLFQRRAKDSLTVIFRRPSSGAEIYEDHFDKIRKNGSFPLTDQYLKRLRQHFKLSG